MVMGSADSRLSTENSSNRQAAMDTSIRVDQPRAFRNTTSFSTVNKNNAVHNSNTTQFESVSFNNACATISNSNNSMKNHGTSVSCVPASSHPDFLSRDCVFQEQFKPNFSVASTLDPAEDKSIEPKDFKCNHSGTCVCMPQTPFLCSFCHLLICKTCSEVAEEISLKDESQEISGTSEGVSEFSVPGSSSSDLHFHEMMGMKKNGMSYDEHVIEAMEYLACRKKLLLSSAPAHLQLKLKNILKNLQQMVFTSDGHKQTQTCMNEIDTRNVNRSRTLLSVCVDNDGPVDIKSLSLVEKTEVEEVDCNDDNDTELICGTCDDTIILYSNDIDLSFKIHCQEARHLLAVGMNETDNVPQTAKERNSQSPTKYSNTLENPTTALSADNAIQLSDSKLEQFRKELSDKGQQDFIQIIVRKISYKFVCTICDTVFYDLDSTKAHLKGTAHKTKLGKLTGTKVKDNKVTENKYSFSCEICKEDFELQTSLEKHIKIHDKKTIVCQKCKKSFSSRAALFQHSKDAHHEATNQKNQETKLTEEEDKPKGLGCKQKSEVRDTLNLLIPTLKESNLKSEQHSTSSNLTPDVPLTPSKIDCLHKISTSDGKALESKWIRVTGKGSFSLDSIFNTFSTFGVIHKIIVLKTEARVLFKDILTAAHVLEPCETLRVRGKKLLVSILSEAESKRIHGALLHVDLTLPNEAAQVIKSEQIFTNTCSRLLEEASHAEEDFVKVKYLCNLLESLLKMVFPKCRSYEFGSRALGLANKNSDVDIFFDIGSNYFGEDASVSQKDICLIVFQALMASSECGKIQKVPGARVPIVKFVHRKMNLACDVSFRCGLGHRNTMLLKHFLGLNKWLRPLILVTKEWLRLSKIKPGKRGMTSYTLVLMIIFYLQSLSPPLLPSVSNLQELTDESKKVFVEGWDCSIPSIQTTFTFDHANQNSTQELLKGFFLFYGNFDFHEYVVCPLLGRTLKRSLFSSASEEEFRNLPSRLSMYLKSLHKNQAPIFQDAKPMCVQDPFELSHNVAKGVPEILLVKFQSHCLSSHKRITMWDFTSNSNLCNPPSFLKSRLQIE